MTPLVTVALSGVFFVAQSVAPTITFARGDIRPIADMPGLFTLPAVTRQNGDLLSVGIVAPHQALIVFASFNCSASTFALTGRAMLSEGSGDRVIIGETEPFPDPIAAEMTPVRDATNTMWQGVAAAVCGSPT